MWLLRISLIVAILVEIGTIVTGFTVIKPHIEGIIDQRNKEKAAKEKLQTQLTATNKVLKATQESLAKETTARKTAEEGMKAAVAKAEETEKARADLATKLADAGKELGDVRQQLAAWTGLGIPVEKVRETLTENKRLAADIEASKEENKILAYNNSKLQNRLRTYEEGQEVKVEMPIGLKGKVTAVDPKYDFVVINVGEKQGVQENGVFLVARNGKLLGKVKVSSVQQTRCVANVMPEWRQAEIREGDEVLY